MNLDQDVKELERLRGQVAGYARDVAERELAGRLLKADLIAQARAEGKTKTDAEADAKLNSAYLAHERRSIELAFLRDVALASAECLQLKLLAQIADRQLVVEAV